MLCEEMELDADEIVEALFLANERLISTKYLRAGMGDGGGCHPRDNIALSWLSRKLNLPFDWFENIMMQREKHTEWLADIICRWTSTVNLPVVICGKAFKKETNLVVGSPSVLLSNILKERGINVSWYDPKIEKHKKFPNIKAIYFIGTNHDAFKTQKFPEGSVVIDPWGIVQQQDGTQLVPVGRR